MPAARFLRGGGRGSATPRHGRPSAPPPPPTHLRHHGRRRAVPQHLLHHLGPQGVEWGCRRLTCERAAGRGRHSSRGRVRCRHRPLRLLCTACALSCCTTREACSPCPPAYLPRVRHLPQRLPVQAGLGVGPQHLLLSAHLPHGKRGGGGSKGVLGPFGSPANSEAHATTTRPLHHKCAAPCPACCLLNLVAWCVPRPRGAAHPLGTPPTFASTSGWSAIRVRHHTREAVDASWWRRGGGGTDNVAWGCHAAPPSRSCCSFCRCSARLRICCESPRHTFDHPIRAAGSSGVPPCW